MATPIVHQFSPETFRDESDESSEVLRATSTIVRFIAIEQPEGVPNTFLLGISDVLDVLARKQQRLVAASIHEN
jgi:hypothetical protein